MDTATYRTPVILVIVTVLFRLIAVLLTLVILAGCAVAMLLGVIFDGPSETARDQLVLTLQQNEYTAKIPSYYLGDALVERICRENDSLPGIYSDRSVICTECTVEETTETVSTAHFTARVSLSANAPALTGDVQGQCFAGIDANGVMVISTDLAYVVSYADHCAVDRILIMDGQLNEALFNSTSGFSGRTAIGQRADGAFVTVTVAGICEQELGATYQDIMEIMTAYGAVNACTLVNAETEE